MVKQSSRAEGEPWVLLADVLAEAAGMDPSRTYASEAEAQARTMRGVRRDWCGRPCVTWSVAAELLSSLKAEQARVLAEAEQRVVAAAEAQLASIPRGIPLAQMAAGVSAAEMLMLSDPFRAERRQSVLEHSLAHPDGALVYHPVGGES
jgi:hypothetical protein